MSVPEETSASRYVKLNKEHEQPVEEIRPGELNQPVYVPQVLGGFGACFRSSLFVALEFFHEFSFYGCVCSNCVNIVVEVAFLHH